MRALFVSLAVVILCTWAGVEIRPRYPQLAVALFTVAVLLALLGLGAFYGMY